MQICMMLSMRCIAALQIEAPVAEAVDTRAIFRSKCSQPMKIRISEPGWRCASSSQSRDEVQGRKSGHGYHKSSKSDQLRCGSLRPCGLLAGGGQTHRDLSYDRK